MLSQKTTNMKNSTNEMTRNIRSKVMRLLMVMLCVLCFDKTMAKNIGKKYSVRFGKHSKKNGIITDNVVRIFLDKEGSYYPESIINDHSLRKNNNSLRNWYSTHRNEFNGICSNLGIPASAFNEQLDSLNRKLARNITSEINNKSKGYDIVNVSIHGFSKKTYGIRIIDRHSTGDNKKLEQALQVNTKKKLFFVEIYWDASYLGVFRSALANKGYKVFRDSAQPHAINVGLCLRKVIANINSERINIITHSLGARVACELLFNAETNNNAQENEATPMQSRIKICMVAPAIGSELFKNYYKRGKITKNPNVGRDNYELSIVYNTNDIVLNKSIPLPIYHLGNLTAYDIAKTALGCDCGNDIDSLETLLAPLHIRTFNLSCKHGKARNGHYLNHCYINNRIPFMDVKAYLND